MSSRSLLALVILAIVAVVAVHLDVATKLKMVATNMLYGDEAKLIKEIRFFVDPFNPDLEQDGIIRDRVWKELIIKLERNGFLTITEDQRQSTPGKPLLTLSIHASKQAEGLYQYVVSLDFTKRESEGAVLGIYKITPLWSTSGMGEGNPSVIRTKIDEVIELFIRNCS
ncbi:MAG: hypothetical protein N2Z74_00660 [Syntrophales bacterium]|nr:hypothetical protein [Syntrophales bacterium]